MSSVPSPQWRSALSAACWRLVDTETVTPGKEPTDLKEEKGEEENKEEGEEETEEKEEGRRASGNSGIPQVLLPRHMLTLKMRQTHVWYGVWRKVIGNPGVLTLI